nr:hypothetical protein [Deinococcus sp. RM]RIY03882.1 hypothetical protein D3W47_13120 [Deinococcus sp. RM]
MTEAFLPHFLRGSDETSVYKPLQRAIASVAKGKGIAATLHPKPSADSSRSSVPIYLGRTIGGEGFYVADLLPRIYDAWMAWAVREDDPGFDRAVELATSIYADLLSRPWGVLCALSYDSFVWLRLGYSPDEDLDPGRMRMVLEAIQRESAWLRTLDGRFTGPLAEKPGPPWAVHNLVTFLAARYGLRPIHSWAEWDANVSALLQLTEAKMQLLK